MKIHEYQAKALLRDFGVPVPRGAVAETVSDALHVASEIGYPVVVKAQIHAGGRGKGGGIKLARDAKELQGAAGSILGMRLRTPQTRPEGQLVQRVLVEEATTPAQELYLGITLDRSLGRLVVIASAAGGMEIEEVAATSPEKILRAVVDPSLGFLPFQGRDLGFRMGLPWEQVRQFAELAVRLVHFFQENDCSLAEINPLVVTTDGRLLALDAKVNFDDNALFRHPEIRALRDVSEEDPLEVQASESGVAYVKLNGFVGCMVNGAGLAMATMDVIKLMGGEPANFLDVGAASAERVASAFRVILSDPDVKSILVNIFGGIARGDIIATGIISAVREVGLKLPLVVRLDGTRAEEGKRMLLESGLPIYVASDLLDAARAAVAAGKQALGATRGER
ncbi:MAG: succinate--CoA ligase [ADP-forming] subunit beta [Dehalococcoidia bacterium]|jgi:succinyl-CoA synthetase beta subunit|nr:MAG: succinate--CoA ligase [ADP-forming] subunit beta [Dehalococcoidia bacterium]